MYCFIRCHSPANTHQTISMIILFSFCAHISLFKYCRSFNTYICLDAVHSYSCDRGDCVIRCWCISRSFFSSVFISLGVFFFACSSSKGCTANQHALHEHFMAWVHVFYSYIRWRPETKRNPRYVKVKQTSIEWLFNRYMLLLANYCHRF